MYYKIRVSISPQQAKRLIKGENIQLKHSDIGKGQLVCVGKRTAMNIQRALDEKTGIRFSLTNKEVRESKILPGGNIFDDIVGLFS